MSRFPNTQSTLRQMWCSTIYHRSSGESWWYAMSQPGWYSIRDHLIFVHIFRSSNMWFSLFSRWKRSSFSLLVHCSFSSFHQRVRNHSSWCWVHTSTSYLVTTQITCFQPFTSSFKMIADEEALNAVIISSQIVSSCSIVVLNFQ